MRKELLHRKNEFGIFLRDYIDYYNMNNNEFAERIGTTPKNLIDILNGNISISQNMIYNISFITGISVSFIEKIEKSFSVEKEINSYIEKNNLTIRQFINKFNYKELSEKYNVSYEDERNDYNIAENILKFLRFNKPEPIYKKDNNIILYKSKNDKPELLALWLEHCYRTVRDQELGIYNKDNIDKLVSFIRKEACNNRFDKERLIKEFNKNGIFLAIEPDLEGAKIRGAFRVLNDKPAIYLTPKYKRIADIYFALFHELAHCKSDYNRAKSGSFVSIENIKSEEDYEIRANKTAFNWMVNDKAYNDIVKSKNYEDNNEIKSFLVYRLAQDGHISYKSKLYQENNIIIN